MEEQKPQGDAPPDPPTEDRAKEGGKKAPPRRKRMTLRDYAQILLYAFIIALVLKVFFIEAYGVPSGSMMNTLKKGDFILVNKFRYGLRSPRTIPLTGIRIPHVRLLPGFARPRRGDVIVFEYPGANDVLEHPEVVNYVKRCIGLPGDTVRIVAKRVYINGELVKHPVGAVFDSFMRDPTESERGIFPKGLPYNKDFWGPLIVPHRGMEIEITMDNLDQWRLFIEREGHSLRFTTDGSIEIDGRIRTSYTVNQDYFFMLGDNRDRSDDSRFWGFVPESNLIGAAMMIYWSWDSSIPFTRPGDLLATIRWDRLFTLVH